MGISGSDQALQYAIAGACRAGATRANAVHGLPVMLVNGVRVDFSDLRISEKRGGGASSASFTARGWDPIGGEDISIRLASINNQRRLFGGYILNPTATYFERPSNRIVQCAVIDQTWALNADLVIGHFTGTYDEVALELMERYAPAGFTTYQVERGLPTVSGGIDFTDVLLSVALERLARRGGVTQFIDYNQDLYFRVTPARITNPQQLTASLVSLKRFSSQRDRSQVINRLYFECQGAACLAEIAPGETIIPVLDASVFPDSGLIKSGTQRMSFSGRVLGGGGALVGTGAAPTSPPDLDLAAGSGVESGLHDYAYVFVTASGRTLPSPIATIDVGFVEAPDDAVIAGAPSSGGSMDAGTHRYLPVFRTAAGSTTPGPVSNTVTAIAATSAPSKPVVGPGGPSGSLVPGREYYWKRTYRRLSDGAETTPSINSDFYFTMGATSAQITPSTPPSGFEEVYYRTLGDAGTGSTYFKVPSLTPSGGFLIDGNADGSLGVAAPSSNNTAKGTCQVTDIPISPCALVTHVDMYRAFNAEADAAAKLAFSVTNGTTSGSDTASNASRGATIPASNTAAANRVSVTVPAGPTGTTDIEIFRTEAGGSDLKKQSAIGSNTASTITDSTPDASLTTAAPTSDDSGLAQPDGQVNAGSTSLEVSNINAFEDEGWVIIGNGQHAVRFTGKSAPSLTGIPASGPGSIQATIAYNSQVTQAPQLSGIPADSPDAGSVTYTIPKGQEVNPVAQLDDTDSQTDIAAIVGGTGVRALSQQNRNLSYAEAVARGQAYLDRRARVAVRASYITTDLNAEVGAVQEIALAPPTNVSETLNIQSVEISGFHENPPKNPAYPRHGDFMPKRRVDASSELHSIEDLLQQDAR